MADSTIQQIQSSHLFEESRINRLRRRPLEIKCKKDRARILYQNVCTLHWERNDPNYVCLSP